MVRGPRPCMPVGPILPMVTIFSTKQLNQRYRSSTRAQRRQSMAIWVMLEMTRILKTSSWATFLRQVWRMVTSRTKTSVTFSRIVHLTCKLLPRSIAMILSSYSIVITTIIIIIIITAKLSVETEIYISDSCNRRMRLCGYKKVWNELPASLISVRTRKLLVVLVQKKRAIILSR